MRAISDIDSYRNLSVLAYANAVLLLSEDSRKLAFFLDHLNGSVDKIEMRFAPSKRKMLLQDWIGSKPNIFLAREQLSELNNCFSPAGRSPVELPLCIQKASVTSG